LIAHASVLAKQRTPVQALGVRTDAAVTWQIDLQP
jgi:hypothetical protein